MSSSDERVKQIERQLAAAQQITHIGSWEWDVETNVVAWSDELYRIYGFEPQSRAITFEFFLSRLHADDRDRVRREVGQALERGDRFAYPERIVRPDGTVRELDTIGEVVRDASTGRPARLIGTCRDVTEERRGRRMHDREHGVLEMIASGKELGVVLSAIVLAIEEHCPGCLGSVLLLDADGERLWHGAAPSLPRAYVEGIDGSRLGPAAGSCGAAAYTGAPVLVEDVESDPRWDDYRHLARAHGLRACWSTPIAATDGRVLGTFALYYREPRAPAAADLELLGRAGHLAGIAIERRQLEDQLRALSAHAESVREEERTGIAREIHDELGQALTALKMDLAWVGRRVSGESSVSGVTLLEKIAAMSTMTDEIIQQVRRISAELRPGVLDDLGLLAAIEWQAQEFEKRTGTSCHVTSNLADDAPLDRELATAVFRIFQEALTNVARHAKAGRVEVRLEAREDRLQLEVTDDGKGISPDAARSPRSLGLLGIRERALRLRGTATIGAASPAGTTVRLELPLARPREGRP